MEKVDVGKIMALRSAGWGTYRIAADMHVEREVVEKAAIRCADDAGMEPVEEGADVGGVGLSIIALTPEQLKEIYEKAADIGAKEALRKLELERKRERGDRADRRLRNTKLLLQNYHMLKEHAENSVFGRTQMEESALDILESMMSMYDDDVVVESIRRSATRTAVIVSHIETMFGLYAAYCDKSTNRDADMRRYEVMWDMYMAEDILSAKEIAQKHHISVRSVYGDLKVATERLSALIFGVDGLKVH
ncbi:hypothetical protein [uncultured Acetatifactor sp.]|jgi:hypothetical protein|uniref:hypothetical protein n=1 Tax=uncultured Acetatifactor sp. TaxID=1671927 RepID=UPI00260F83F6|nr:hypothetical protein [uncultured Acetatifactor sp.]